MCAQSPRDRLFGEWLGEHRGIMARVASSFAPGGADRCDLEQEIMLQVWGSAESFGGQSKASTWIYRVALNTALMWSRGLGRRRRRIDPGASVDAVPEGAAGPAESAAKVDLLEVLYEGIRALPDTDRAVILLSLDGLSYREMSEITGLTENHIGVALTRARAKLAERLKGVRNELE